MRDLGLTFAGGGNRSFYQQGLVEAWGERIWPRVAAVSGCSAGSAIAILLLSGRRDQARSHWDGLRKGITKNIDFARALRGGPIAPHGPIYRSTVVHSLIDGGLERIRALPFPIYVLCSIAPSYVPMGAAVWLGFGAYAFEKQQRPEMLHPRAGHTLGYREFVFDARDCETPDELADLVLASSATPPFTPVGNFRGTLLLDGGIVDNAPAYLVERHPDVKQNLVLLSRPYPVGAAGERGMRLYLAPSEPVPVERWDYTERAPVEETLALGARDAQRFEPVLTRWLSRSAPAVGELQTPHD